MSLHYNYLINLIKSSPILENKAIKCLYKSINNKSLMVNNEKKIAHKYLLIFIFELHE